MAFGVKSKKAKEKKKNRYEVLKLNQYFGGKPIFIIVDMNFRGQSMYHIKDKFNSRAEANKY